MGFTLYCDSVSDEHLAVEWLGGGPLAEAEVLRLPSYASAPEELRPLLAWERLDWVICADTQPVVAVEFSRHGYTGDNSFQRFARLYRAASLGIPVLYFTSFARARLNELDVGRNSPRNVAPELFQTMERLSDRFGVPCLGVNWPITAGGTPAPLTADAVKSARHELVSLVEFFATEGNPGPNQSLKAAFPQTVEGMAAQAALPFRGSETRGPVDLPINLPNSTWIRSWLPETYFSRGKADKILASAALDLVNPKPIHRAANASPFWEAKGRAWCLFLGYQWRPDPACGLIALAAANAVAEDVPLLVVWPRVFYQAGNEHKQANEALAQFRATGTGLFFEEGQRLGFSNGSLDRFRARVSVEPNQFGVYTKTSKIARVLQDTAAAVLLSDRVEVLAQT